MAKYSPIEFSFDQQTESGAPSLWYCTKNDKYYLKDSCDIAFCLTTRPPCACDVAVDLVCGESDGRIYRIRRKDVRRSFSCYPLSSNHFDPETKLYLRLTVRVSDGRSHIFIAHLDKGPFPAMIPIVRVFFDKT
jgi:hypothetical protein